MHTLSHSATITSGFPKSHFHMITTKHLSVYCVVGDGNTRNVITTKSSQKAGSPKQKNLISSVDFVSGR